MNSCCITESSKNVYLAGNLCPMSNIYVYYSLMYCSYLICAAGVLLFLAKNKE